MRLQCARVRSRLTPVCPNALFVCKKHSLGRHLSIQMHFRYAKTRSPSKPVNQNALATCTNALSLDACRSKCVFGLQKRSLARRLSVQMHFRHAKSRSRLTPVNPNALAMCAGALSLDACRVRLREVVTRNNNTGHPCLVIGMSRLEILLRLRIGRQVWCQQPR